ncbi:MAG: hypothetical protein H0A76_06980 [Candidatus Thiodubiliella endoseptemdiera]|uniref:Uncharacterized protein n=1 Tax=Candidatus Thiodubiliella endoseptemdiera TaxID=2738886 RepID=A0A853F3S9_9GAMM|nr:hypothetical protein [Candidatus Thiodubiliella endoseptemdiera]
MPGQTKYFISNTNGFFVNWYSDITGVESHGQALKDLAIVETMPSM